MMKRIISIFLISLLLMCHNMTYAADNEIIISTKSSQYTEVSGQWSNSSLTDADGTKTRYSSNGVAQWRPELEKGKYLVSVYKLANSDSDKEAKLEIFYDGGADEVTVDYSKGPSGWVSLGAYPFKSGTDGYVQISKGSGTVRCGSVKFELIDEAAAKANEAAVNFVDIEYSEHKASIELLAHLGIMNGIEENEFGPSFYMSRAEFATLIAKNILKLSGGNKSLLPLDVAKDYWAADAICVMNELGYMTGFDDGTFRPEESVTYNQVIKILVSVLGYEYEVKMQGGAYPSAWLNVAGELDLMTLTQASGEEKVKRDTVARIIDNALEVEIPKVTYSGSSVNYYTDNDDTFLNFLGYQLVKGRISANDFISLDGDERLAEGRIKINDTVYYEGYTNSDDFLGQAVEMYATKTGDIGEYMETAVYIRPDDDTTVIIIDAEDISEQSNVDYIYYYEGDKLKKLRLDPYAKMIYNGGSKIAWTNDDFKLEAGYIKVITPSSGGADTVFVNNYKNLVVEDVDANRDIIYFKNQTEEWKSVDLKKYDALKITNAYGAVSNIGKIKSGDVVSAAISEDKDAAHFIVSDIKVSGEVTAYTEEAVTVNSIEYEYSNTVKNDEDIILPSIGDMRVFLIDFQGKIAAVETDMTVVSNYGYLINMTRGEEPDGNARFKIIDATGEVNSYDASEKIFVNDKKYSAEGVLSSEYLKYQGEVKQQLIVYKLNSQKQIQRIYTPVDLTNGSERSDDCKIAKEVSAASATFRGGKQTAFSSRYFVGDKTLFFMVPSDADKATNERAYAVYGKSYFTDNGEKSYSNLEFYDIDENQVASVIVQKVGDNDSIRNRADIAIISSVSKMVDPQNNVVDSANAYVGGKETLLMFDEYFEGLLLDGYAISDPQKDEAATEGALPKTIAANMLKSGDIIQYELNSMGKINKARVLLRIDSPIEKEFVNASSGMTNAGNDTYASIYYGLGTLDKKLNNGIMYTVTNGSDVKTRALTTTGAIFYKLERRNGNICISQSGLNELVQGETVFVRKNGNDVLEVVACP